MIKLFRNIRKNLLAEGKTTRYLKYAIGEIILVVIGILIALSINNWNEHRKLKIEEVKIINRLIKETKKDIFFYKSRIDGINKDVEIYKNFLLIGEGKANDSILNIKLLKNFVFDSTWAYESSVVKNNSNTIEMMESSEIQEKLQEVFFQYEYVDKTLSIDNNLKMNQGTPLNIKYYKSLYIPNPTLPYSHFKNMLSDPQVLGTLNTFINMDLYSIDKIEKMQKTLSEFLELLETYSNETDQ